MLANSQSAVHKKLSTPLDGAFLLHMVDVGVTKSQIRCANFALINTESERLRVSHAHWTGAINIVYLLERIFRLKNFLNLLKLIKFHFKCQNFTKQEWRQSHYLYYLKFIIKCLGHFIVSLVLQYYRNCFSEKPFWLFRFIFCADFYWQIGHFSYQTKHIVHGNF